MFVRFLIVEPDRDDHIARHNVESDEAEEVAYGIHHTSRSRQGRYRLIGQTMAGRYLAVIVAPRAPGVFALVTARDATDAERRLYRSQRGR